MLAFKRLIPALASGLALGLAAGCYHHDCETMCVDPPAPLGTLSDPVWQKQEENAEASKFVIYEHEFIANTSRLNRAGEDHVKEIAARAGNVPFPILVEQSSMSRRAGDKYGYPIHNNHNLDVERRTMIVRTLVSMGVQDAEERVVVSPALTPGFEGFEAENAYYQMFNGAQNRNFNTGYGVGGLGGFGGFGGFGFGGF